jgi:hypothetical protein
LLAGAAIDFVGKILSKNSIDVRIPVHGFYGLLRSRSFAAHAVIIHFLNANLSKTLTL